MNTLRGQKNWTPTHASCYIWNSVRTCEGDKKYCIYAISLWLICWSCRAFHGSTCIYSCTVYTWNQSPLLFRNQKLIAQSLFSGMLQTGETIWWETWENEKLQKQELEHSSWLKLFRKSMGIYVSLYSY